MKNARILFVSPVIFLIISGCVSKEQFYDDVSLSRESAYKQWEVRKTTEKQAQAIVAGKLTLEDCIKLTLTNNKGLLRTLEEREVARGGEVGSYSAIIPGANATAQYQRVDKVETLSFPSSPVPITLGALDNYTAGLQVTQPLFAGGANIARINAARLGTLLADQVVRGAVQETVYAAQSGYYTILLNQRLYEISDDAVRSARANLSDVNQRHTVGVASNYDVLRAEVELSNFTAQFIQSRNAINVSKANLIKVMGISQDSNFSPAGELEYRPISITMEQAVASAYRNRPDLFTRELNIKQQKELLTIAQSRYFPVISGFYTNSLAKPDPHDPMKDKWGDAWSYGLSASWGLFDGFAREGSIISQKARVKQSQIDLIDSEETALLEVTKALLSIEDAAEFVDSQKLNLSRATEGLRLVEAGYREGTNTQVEVLDAQTALTTARANYYQAIYDHLVANLDLQKAMGTLTGYEPGKRAIEATATATTGKQLVSTETK